MSTSSTPAQDGPEATEGPKASDPTPTQVESKSDNTAELSAEAVAEKVLEATEKLKDTLSEKQCACKINNNETEKSKDVSCKACGQDCDCQLGQVDGACAEDGGVSIEREVVITEEKKSSEAPVTADKQEDSATTSNFAKDEQNESTPGPTSETNGTNSTSKEFKNMTPIEQSHLDREHNLQTAIELVKSKIEHDAAHVTVEDASLLHRAEMRAHGHVEKGGITGTAQKLAAQNEKEQKSDMKADEIAESKGTEIAVAETNENVAEAAAAA